MEISCWIGWNTVLSFFTVNKFREIKEFAGLANYIRVLTDETFLQAIGNTLVFVITTVPVSIVIGLALALLAKKRRKTSSVYEAMYALSMAISVSVVAMIFQFAFNPSMGIINKVTGLDISWLTDPKTALAIENMWGEKTAGVPHYAVQPEEVLRLIEDIQCDNVKVCWDVEHGSIEKINQTEALHMLKNHIVTTHISDEAGVNQIHILPYFGNIDWEELLKAFADIGYNGIFNFEIQHYLPGVPEELILPAMKFSREVGTYLVKRLEEMKKS